MVAYTRPSPQYYDGPESTVVHGQHQKKKRELLKTEVDKHHKSKKGKTRKERELIDEMINSLVIQYNEELNLRNKFDLHWMRAIKYASKIMMISDGPVEFITGKGENSWNRRANIKEAMEKEFGGWTQITVLHHRKNEGVLWLRWN
ncbi:unnamed protein product [Caenorhabditis brenneri]